MTLLLLLNLFVQSIALPAPKLWGVKPTATNESMPAQSIEWMQDAPSMDAIWRYVYRLYLDDDKTGKQLGGLQCKGSYTPYQCASALPNLTTTVGTHKLRLTVAQFLSGDSIQHPSQTGPESWSNPVDLVVKQPPPHMYLTMPYAPPPVVIK